VRERREAARGSEGAPGSSAGSEGAPGSSGGREGGRHSTPNTQVRGIPFVSNPLNPLVNR
jgi:hypothetical protein